MSKIGQKRSSRHDKWVADQMRLAQTKDFHTCYVGRVGLVNRFEEKYDRQHGRGRYRRPFLGLVLHRRRSTNHVDSLT